MRHYGATTPQQLADLPVHDAWFDPAELRDNPTEGTVVIPFAQEAVQWEDRALPPEVPQREFIKESTWFNEYRVPLLAACLTIRHAVSVDADEGWGDMGTLLGVEFDASSSEVSVWSSGALRVGVSALEVEAQITREVAHVLRRRVDKLVGAEFDTVWE